MSGGPAARSLVAVVVTHDRLAKLRQTLAALLAAPAHELEAVVVVDNHSADGTAAWLAGQDDPRLTVLSLDENIGGAGGFERGMRLAAARFDPDWMVLMDDDGRPCAGAIAGFHAADTRGWEAIAAAVYYPDGQICPVNRPGHNSFARCRPFHLPAAAYDGAVQAVDHATFVGLFVSRAAVARAGYPDGRLFLYGDDGLYTLKLSQAGGRIGFFPAIRFEHDCSTFCARPGRFRPLWKAYYHHRNLLMVYRRAAGWKFWPLLAVIVPKWTLKVRHHPGERRDFLHLLGLALRDGMAGRTGTDHAALLARFGGAGRLND